MTKHTEGPWSVGDRDERDNAIPIMGEKYLEVARVQPRAFHADSQVNNARLIAAAPELLAALRGVVHHNEALKDQFKLSPSLMRQVEFAIAKAEGKES